MSSREGNVLGAQGTRLFWRAWDAPRARGSLLLVHGLGEHSGRYGAFSRHLAEAGISVFAFDLRGHGRSEGPRGDVGAFPHYLQDLLAMEEVVERESPEDRPRFLLGHSLGGLIGLRRLQIFQAPYSGAVFSAPWLATALPGWMRSLGSFLGLALPGISLPSGLRSGKLTRDPEMARAWEEDPMNYARITPRLFREVERVQKEVLDHRGAFRPPLLFLVPSGDQVVRSAVTEAFARGIVGGEIRVEILPGRLHEPLNDLGREEVVARVAHWLEEKMSVPPGDPPGGAKVTLNLDDR